MTTSHYVTMLHPTKCAGCKTHPCTNQHFLHTHHRLGNHQQHNQPP